MSEITVDRRNVGPIPANRKAGGRVRSLPARFLRRMGAAIGRWWRNRQAIQTLTEADTAILRDLGISRSDVERVVHRGRR